MDKEIKEKYEKAKHLFGEPKNVEFLDFVGYFYKFCDAC